MKTILNTLIFAFKELYLNAKTLVIALAIPSLLICFFDYFPFNNEALYLGEISGIISVLIYCYIAIITHRIIVLGPESVPTYGIYKPTKREASFVLHFVGVILLACLPFGIIVYLKPAFITEKIVISLILIVLFCTSRVSIVFPAIAVNEKWSFHDAWRATKNYKMLVLVNNLLVPTFIEVSLFLAEDLIRFEVINVILSKLSTIVSIAIISATYHHIKNDKLTQRSRGTARGYGVCKTQS